MKLSDIRIFFSFTIAIISGVLFKIVFNDSIVLGVMIGVIVSYIAMIGVLKELDKTNFMKEIDKKFELVEK